MAGRHETGSTHFYISFALTSQLAKNAPIGQARALTIQVSKNCNIAKKKRLSPFFFARDFHLRFSPLGVITTSGPWIKVILLLRH